jgi:hypothetical protein
MHPLVGSLSELKTSELEGKITDLTKKYFMTGNMDARQQISMVLDSYKTELNRRHEQALAKVMSDKSLDKLVKVN